MLNKLGSVAAEQIFGCFSLSLPDAFVCQQTLMETPLPVHTLMKVKEELLRQRELEILRFESSVYPFAFVNFPF